MSAVSSPLLSHCQGRRQKLSARDGEVFKFRWRKAGRNGLLSAMIVWIGLAKVLAVECQDQW